eukprot:10799375-Lingulodinium_polyedra.AAC.1
MDGSWIINGCFMDYLMVCGVHGSSMDGSWLINGWFMAHQWMVHGSSMDGSCLLNGWLKG